MNGVLLPVENLEHARDLLRERRVVLNFTQKEAAERSGVNIETLRHFEKTGRISLLNFLKLLNVYQMDHKVMQALEDRSGWTLNQLKKAETRKRAHK